jgi:hypothetical protein
MQTQRYRLRAISRYHEPALGRGLVCVNPTLIIKVINMPKPRKGESKTHYVSRFMSSKESQSDFPDSKQRVAVAYSMYDQHKHKKK